MEYIIETRALTKRYGRNKAVDSVSLRIRQGEIYGLIGRNSAGKTTLLRCLSGLAAPTEGEYLIFGENGRNNALLASRVGSLIERPGLYPNMSAYENLRLKCGCLGIKDKKLPERLLGTVGLENAGRCKTKKFSLGMKQRLGIAMALVGAPDVVVLDEPINGLDPQGIAGIRDMILRLNKENNITFIISSHILEELSKLCTNFGIINNGAMAEEFTSEELHEKCMERIELSVDTPQLACTVLEKIGIINYKCVSANEINIYERVTDSGEIAAALSNAGIKVLKISVCNESLEEYFLGIVGGENNA